MALNTFGVGAEISATDNASKALKSVTGNAMSMAGAFGGAGGAMGNMLGMAGMLPSVLGAGGAAAGGLAAALGPIAIAIGAIVAAFSLWNDVATKTNMTLQESIGTFQQYEAALAEVQTILGSTREEMAAVTDQALSFGATYGKAPTEELKGFYQTASAGFADAADASRVMDTANKLAVGGITSMNASVDLLTTVLNGFGISAENSIVASDALFTTVKAGKTTVGELAAAFGNVVPSAAAAGAKLDESAAALAALTLAGQSTAEASTALARAFDVLIKQPPAMVKAFQKYGIEQSQLDVRGRGLQAVIKDIGEAFKGNEEELSRAIPQIRAFKAIMPLATTQAEKFNEILGMMADKTGATDDAFNIIANTLDFQKKRWTSMTEAVKIRIGQVFAPAIRTALDVLNDMLGIVEKLPTPMKNLIFGITGVGLALPTVINKIGSFVFLIVKLAAAYMILAPFLQMIPMMLVSLGANITAISPMLSRIIKLVIAWKDNVGGLQEKLQQFQKSFKLVIRGIGEAIAGEEGLISGPIAKELEEAGVTQFVAGLFTLFRRFQVFVDTVWTSFKDVVLAGVEGLEDIFPFYSKFLEVMGEGAEGAGKAIAKIFPIDKVKQWGKTAGMWLGAIVKWLSDLGKDWEKVAAKGLDFATDMKKVADSLKTIAELAEKLLPVAEALGSAFAWLGYGPTAEDIGKEEGAKAAGAGEGGLLESLGLPKFSLPTEGEPGGVAPVTPELVTPGTAGLGMIGGQPVYINLNLSSKTEVDGKVLAEVVQAKQIEMDEEGQVQD